MIFGFLQGKITKILQYEIFEKLIFEKFPLVNFDFFPWYPYFGGWWVQKEKIRKNFEETHF